MAAADVSDEDNNICLCNLLRHLSRIGAKPIRTFAKTATTGRRKRAEAMISPESFLMPAVTFVFAGEAIEWAQRALDAGR